LINLEQLKLRFPVKNVPPHGECIVVPGDQFDPDWEVGLDEGGYVCINTDVDGKPVTLVPVTKRASGNTERTVYEPRVVSRPHSVVKDRKIGSGPGHIAKVTLPLGLSAMKGPQWSREDEDRLVKRVSDLTGSLKEKCRILTEEFKGRSVMALKQKFKKLVEAGRALPGKRGRPKKVLSVPGLQKALENVCHDCGLPKDLCCCDDEKKESLRREIQTHEEQIEKGLRGHAQKSPIKASAPGVVSFEAYCRKCRTRRTVQDYDVWRRCPVCLEPLIIWNVQETEV